MSGLPRRLDLPLFVTTRLPKRRDRMEEMKQYIRSRAEQYTNKCIEDKIQISASHKKLLASVGLDRKPLQTTYPPAGKRTEERFKDSKANWYLPPNLYDSLREPYGDLKGAKGAYWHKDRDEPKKVPEKDNYKFYHKPSCVDEWTSRNAIFKGKMLSNARKKRPTARGMVHNPSTCYRNPDEPSPAEYHVEHHEIQHNMAEAQYEDCQMAYKFYNFTTVPVKDIVVSRKMGKTLAGPGRYETRYDKVCFCSSRKKYAPDFYVYVDTQKRNKFRRKKWIKVQKKKYFDPNLGNVVGNGFTWLFKLPRKEKLQLKAQRDLELKRRRGKKQVNIQQLLSQLKLYADARYIDLINKTGPRVDSYWPILPRKERIIKFNSIFKLKPKKKQVASNAIGFNSGVPRFDDVEKKPSMTDSQLVAVINSLPERLRLVNKPALTIPKEDIKPRVYDIPLPTHTVMRKKPYRFPEMPKTIMLMSEDVYHVQKSTALPFYKTKYVPENYFKKLRRSTS